jgi:hypothetical protein
MEWRQRPCVVWNCGTIDACYAPEAAIVCRIERRKRLCVVCSGGSDRACYGPAAATVPVMELR